MFDIMQEAVAETADLELKRADGSPMVDKDGKALSVTICGPGSKTYAQAEAEARRRLRARASKNPNDLAAALDSEPDELDFLATITVSFNGWEFPNPDGKWKSQREMFKAAYGTRELIHIRRQVEQFHGDMGNFFKG